MDKKETGNNQKEQSLEDWIPTPMGSKTKSVRNDNKSLEEECQEMIANGIGGIFPKRNAMKEQENSIETDDTIQTEERTIATDSLQTTEVPSKRISTKQRKESLEEYRATFLQIPKIEDRKPVFVSREVRDMLDEIVRRLGMRKMSISGFIENLARHHLDCYGEDVEVWKKL